MFTNANKKTVSSKRILYTPSQFARDSLLYLQEVGQSKALSKHSSSRENLSSYLCLTILSGSGTLRYGEECFDLSAGDCVFLDCRVPYSHSTSEDLWSLAWVHFNGPVMGRIYEKYKARGGKVVFRSEEDYNTLFQEIYRIANSDSYVRDMSINAKLSELLVLLMKDSWNPENVETVGKRTQLTQVKNYIDENFFMPITLEGLSEHFYINKTYLSEIFKEKYGVGVNEYLIEKRITRSKELLRFTDKTMEEIAEETGVNGAAYFSRLFKKVEGISPNEYRKMWL